MHDPWKKPHSHHSIRDQNPVCIKKGCTCARRSCLCNAPSPWDIALPALQDRRRQKTQQRDLRRTLASSSKEDTEKRLLNDGQHKGISTHGEYSVAKSVHRRGSVAQFQQISSKTEVKLRRRSDLPNLLTSVEPGKRRQDKIVCSDAAHNQPVSARIAAHMGTQVTENHDGNLSESFCSRSSTSCGSESTDQDTSQALTPRETVPAVVAEITTCLRGAFRNSIEHPDQPDTDSSMMGQQNCCGQGRETDSKDESRSRHSHRQGADQGFMERRRSSQSSRRGDDEYLIDRRRSSQSSRQGDNTDLVRKRRSSQASSNVSAYSKLSGYSQLFAPCPRFKTPLSERLKRVQLCRSEKVKEIRGERIRELKKRRYDALPRSEVEDIETAFHQFDRNRTGFIVRDMIVPCLIELGITGKTVEEKQELGRAFQCTVGDCCRPPWNWRIAQPCCSTCSQTQGSAHTSECNRNFKAANAGVLLDADLPHDHGASDANSASVQLLHEARAEDKSCAMYHTSIDLFDFALVVMPEVRQRLMFLRSAEMLKQFYQIDRDNSGILSRSECREIARRFGIDRRLVDDACAKRNFQGIDFEQFQVLVFIGQEKAERRIRLQERAIQEQLQIRDEIFGEFRNDLMVLYQLFQLYDADGSGTLGDIEVSTMFNEFGLTPRTEMEKKEIEDLLQRALLQRAQPQAGRFAPAWGKVQAKVMQRRGVFRANGFNFEDFLCLIGQIREHKRIKNHDEYLDNFERYDKDGNGTLSVSEVWDLLSDLGFKPLSYKEQSELAYLVHVSDEDMSGHIDFSEFQVLCQKIEEKLLSLRYEEEMDHALRLGFTDERIRDLRLLFDALDVDASGKLSEAEIYNAMQLIADEISQDDFKAAFNAIDTDRDRELDFKEFLTFMKMVRDGEGLFAVLPQKATSLQTRVLRRVLEHFHLEKSYVNTLPKEDLIHLFNDFMGVEEDSCDLQKALGLATIDDLLDVAKKRAGRSAVASH